ncbi:MAG: CinA family protein [Candidatus Omnitrophica bacterium]|jgi:nicotinamide mononucleotide (NMN) deamidase PncC|nr:CinA family protein [Candidatus Omnitrophota bacterium]
MAKLKNLIFYLRIKKLTISAVESVSGGYLSYLLTKTPGSSKVFKGGLIVYSPESKNKLLHIPLPLLNKTLGVSKSISILLAKRTKQFFKTDLAVSLVGFASAPAQKGIKVGTIFMAVADRYGVASKKILLKGSRDYVRKQASRMAVDLLCRRLNSKH